MSYEKLYGLLVALILIVSSTACSPNGSAPSPPPTTPTPTVPAGTFTGRALRAGTSTPIVSAAVTVFQADVPVTTTTDGSGAFSFAGLAAGASTLEVRAPGFVDSTSSVTVPQASYVVMLAPVGAPTTATLLSVAVTGNAVMTAAGQTSQLAAASVRSDGVLTDVTSIAKWTSSAPTVAAVSSSGLVTAYAAGQAEITATFRDVSGGLVVLVNIE